MKPSLTWSRPFLPPGRRPIRSFFLSVTLIAPFLGCTESSPTSSGALPGIQVQRIDIDASVLDLSFDREGRTFDLLARRPQVFGLSPEGDRFDVGPWRRRLMLDPVRSRAYYHDGEYHGIDLATGEVTDPFPFSASSIALDDEGRVVAYETVYDHVVRRTFDPVTTQEIEVVELRPQFWTIALSCDGDAAVGFLHGSDALVVARGGEVHVVETEAGPDVLRSDLRAVDPTGRRFVYRTPSGWMELDLDSGETTTLPWSIEEPLIPRVIQWTDTGVHLASGDALLRVDEDATVTREPIPLSDGQSLDSLVPVRGSDPWAAIQTSEIVIANGTIGASGLVSQVGDLESVGPVRYPLIATSPDGSRVAFLRHTGVNELVVRDRTGDETTYGLPLSIRSLLWTARGITLLDSGRNLLRLDPASADPSLENVALAPEAYSLLPGAPEGRIAIRGPGLGSGRFEVRELDERDGKTLHRRAVDGVPVAAAPHPIYGLRYLCWEPSGLTIDGLPRTEVWDVELRSGSGRFRPGTDTILAWSGTEVVLLLRR